MARDLVLQCLWVHIEEQSRVAHNISRITDSRQDLRGVVGVINKDLVAIDERTCKAPVRRSKSMFNLSRPTLGSETRLAKNESVGVVFVDVVFFESDLESVICSIAGVEASRSSESISHIYCACVANYQR